MGIEIKYNEKQVIESLFRVNLQLSMGLAEASKYLPPYAAASVAKVMKDATK